MKEKREQRHANLPVAHKCGSAFRMSPQTQKIVADTLAEEIVLGPFGDAETALTALYAVDGVSLPMYE